MTRPRKPSTRSASRLRWALAAFRDDTAGVATAASLYILIVMLMIGGLAVDLSNAIRAQARLQALADTVAMSAAMHLPDAAAATSAALDTATRNQPATGSRRAEIVQEDIVIGIWDPATRGFQPGGGNPTAVLVTARHSAQNGSALPTLLLRLVGVTWIDVGATAVGYRPRFPRCSGAGYFSRERTVVVNSNHFSNGFCLHGEAGVTLNNVNTFDPGTTIGMPDLADFEERRNNYGAREALTRYSHSFARLDALPGIMSAMRAGSLSAADLPGYIRHGPVHLNSINANTELEPGTLYIVSGNVNLGSNIAVSEIAIVATGTIRVNSNTELKDVVLASNGTITINSNNYLGESEQEYCRTGRYSSYLLSRSDITFGTNNTLRGVMMLTDGRLDGGNNNDAADGVYVEAGGRISLGNANSNNGCPEGLERELGPEHLPEITSSMVF